METVKDRRTTNGTNATAHTINTPRGCFEVSATYRTGEEATAAGFGYYFMNDDGREIYTAHNDPENPERVSAFAVVDKNAPAPVEENPRPAYILIYRDEARRIFAANAAGDVERLTADDLRAVVDGNTDTERARIAAREILEKIEREEAEEKNAAENFGRCKRIADELSELAAGRLYVCPHCGGIHNPEELEKTENEDGETVYTCPECGEELEEGEAEQATAADYFAEALDFDFITDANKKYKGARVLVAWGGPSISIDTERGAVVLDWWGDTARAFMSSDAVELVDEFARELFEMR